ncbi:tRNA pseudouridine(38/39) synthase isoform X2 [Pyrus x bretschneideri]|uniref:tRNA pseudouridine(38/39) synthase isoform X2 n=1 Tax=Pyrus x bretschneideri TaxID=225117 RepID=UPI00202F52AF|nr:tRNA pseudouridine(38/39) synthase isoform X2 [Pyrus x bretschneideri]
MSMEVADRDPITNLQSLVDSLKHRVQKEKKPDGSVSFDSSVEKSRKSNSGSKKTTNEKVKETVPGHITRIMNYLPKRYVALKVMYFGQRFYGFASEAQMDPTIESEIFKALEKTRLLVGDKKESQYSRCGRTDKGVSAVGQVIALYLRSNLKETCENNEDSNKIVCNEQYEGEIDYVRVLNRALPEDIRVFGWCPVPLDFNARFSCLGREYYYLFWGQNLNLLAMESAGRKFVGEHDFRNFCKMDALNVHNYRRKITSFAVSPCDVRFDENQLWAIKIKGSAFLWHQVRCMVAVLFLIGQGHESPDVVDALLDTSRTPRKPQYTMAPEIPLVLQSCEFEGLKFTCSSDAGQALRVHLAKECQSYHLQAAIFHEALRSCLPIEKDQSSLENRTIKKKCAHVPLVSRPTERKCYRLFVNRIEPIITRKVERCAASYDERRAKLNSKA